MYLQSDVESALAHVALAVIDGTMGAREGATAVTALKALLAPAIEADHRRRMWLREKAERKAEGSK